MTDITKKLLTDLDLMAPTNGTPVGAKPDMTTWMARKLAQDRQIGATSEAPLYDGTDIQEEVQIYLRDLPD